MSDEDGAMMLLGLIVGGLAIGLLWIIQAVVSEFAYARRWMNRRSRET